MVGGPYDDVVLCPQWQWDFLEIVQDYVETVGAVTALTYIYCIRGVLF